jgi:hypothetical protein
MPISTQLSQKQDVSYLAEGQGCSISAGFAGVDSLQHNLVQVQVQVQGVHIGKMVVPVS